MSTERRTFLPTLTGFRSQEAAAFMAGLDDQRQRLLGTIAGITPEELGWQPAPGMNSIGMLLTHLAVSETHIADVGLANLPKSRVPEVLGMTTDDDGLPLADDGRPPDHLTGRALPYFVDLLSRSRAHVREVASQVGDDDWVREIVRVQPNGDRRIFDPRWMLYHLLEHEAGHHAQIQLLRHLHRKRPA